MEGTALADRLQEKVAGACLIVGALLMTPNTFFEYREGTLFWAGLVGVVAYICLVPGLLGVARLLRQRAPRLSVLGGLLVTIGTVGGAIFAAAPMFEWAEREAGTPEAMMVAITDVLEGQVFPVLVTFGALFPISLVLLSVGLFRTGVVPKWVAMLLGTGAVVFPAGHIGESELITHLAELVLLVPFVWIGLRSLTDAKPSSIAVPAIT
ncbi:MAG: hypothetical protein ACRDJE_29780 [Dehalococcoidia bacterium]